MIDAILVGDSPDANLRKLVTATGGECFQISSLGAGFELLENEGVVSLRARRGGVPKPPYVRPAAPVDLAGTQEKAFTRTAELATSAASCHWIMIDCLRVTILVSPFKYFQTWVRRAFAGQSETTIFGC